MNVFSCGAINKKQLAVLYHSGISSGLPKKIDIIYPTPNSKDYNFNVKQKIHFPYYFNPTDPDMVFHAKRKQIIIYERKSFNLVAVNIETKDWTILQENVWDNSLAQFISTTLSIFQSFAKIIIDNISDQLYMLAATMSIEDAIKMIEWISNNKPGCIHNIGLRNDQTLNLYRFNYTNNKFELLHETDITALYNLGYPYHCKLIKKVLPLYNKRNHKISDFLIYKDTEIIKLNINTGLTQNIKCVNIQYSNVVTLSDNSIIRVSEHNDYEEMMLYTSYKISLSTSSLIKNELKSKKKWKTLYQHKERRPLMNSASLRIIKLENVYEDQLTIEGFYRQYTSVFNLDFPQYLIWITSQFFSRQQVLSYILPKSSWIRNRYRISYEQCILNHNLVGIQLSNVDDIIN